MRVGFIGGLCPLIPAHCGTASIIYVSSSDPTEYAISIPTPVTFDVIVDSVMMAYFSGSKNLVKGSSSRASIVLMAAYVSSVSSMEQGLTLVPFSAQLELTLPMSAQLKLTVSPTSPKLTRGCGPKVLKLSSDVSDVSRRSSS